MMPGLLFSFFLCILSIITSSATKQDILLAIGCDTKVERGLFPIDNILNRYALVIKKKDVIP